MDYEIISEEDFLLEEIMNSNNEYCSMDMCPPERINLSLLNQLGLLGSKFK